MVVSQSQYIFANSLVNFAGGNAQTNIMVWMNAFANEAAHDYSVSGSFGFLRQFADADEPLSQWGFPEITQAWDPDQSAFADAQFDSVLITPANFIQWIDPDAPYDGDTRSPLDAVQEVVERMVAQQPDARLYIYQGWADMGGYTEEIPPTDDALAAYHAYNQGEEYGGWYESLVQAVNDAQPDANLALIPVAPILSELMTTTLRDIPAEEFYVDTAPHGTETTYYLAAMITYQATYGEAPPPIEPLPDVIHPAIGARYDEIVALIEARIEEADLDALWQADADEMALGDLNAGPDAADAAPAPDPDARTPEEVSADAQAANAASALAISADPGPAYVATGFSAGAGDVLMIPAPGDGSGRGDGIRADDAAGEPALDQGFDIALYALDPGVLSLDAVDFAADPVATGSLESVDFAATDAAFLEGAGADHVAARLTRTLESDEGGSYRIDLVADDAARLFIDGESVLEASQADSGAPLRIDVDLAPGSHEIEIHHLETTGEATLSVALSYLGPLDADDPLLTPGADPSDGADLMDLLSLGPQESEVALAEAGAAEADAEEAETL